jgi:hypothetical protein
LLDVDLGVSISGNLKRGFPLTSKPMKHQNQQNRKIKVNVVDSIQSHDGLHHTWQTQYRKYRKHESLDKDRKFWFPIFELIRLKTSKEGQCKDVHSRMSHHEQIEEMKPKMSPFPSFEVRDIDRHPKQCQCDPKRWQRVFRETQKVQNVN